MPEKDTNEYWLLKHADGRHIIIARRPKSFGVDEIEWVETKGDAILRKGAWGCGIYANTKPADEIARLLERFRGEGYELVSIRTRLSAAVLKLLRDLDTLDAGNGVETTMLPRNGWQVKGGGRYSKFSFRELDGLGVIDTGNGFDDNVKILPVGRDLARYSQRRRAQAGVQS